MPLANLAKGNLINRQVEEKEEPSERVTQRHQQSRATGDAVV